MFKKLALSRRSSVRYLTGLLHPNISFMLQVSAEVKFLILLSLSFQINIGFTTKLSIIIYVLRLQRKFIGM